MTTKKAKKKTKKGSKGKTKPASKSKGTTKPEALTLIDGLDSKHESLQPVLRKLAGGEAVSEKELDTLAESDSRASAVVPILRAIADGSANAETVTAIDALDSFGAPLQPVLLALATK